MHSYESPERLTFLCSFESTGALSEPMPIAPTAPNLIRRDAAPLETLRRQPFLPIEQVRVRSVTNKRAYDYLDPVMMCLVLEEMMRLKLLPRPTSGLGQKIQVTESPSVRDVT